MNTPPPWLLELTFCIEYSPNCPSRWLVRLPGKSAVIDKKPYTHVPADQITGDALGFGETLQEAAEAARDAKAAMKGNGKAYILVDGGNENRGPTWRETKPGGQRVPGCYMCGLPKTLHEMGKCPKDAAAILADLEGTAKP